MRWPSGALIRSGTRLWSNNKTRPDDFPEGALRRAYSALPLMIGVTETAA